MNHLLSGLFSGKDPAALFAEIPETPARTITYGELLAASGRYANALVARGVKPGDRVAVQVPSTSCTANDGSVTSGTPVFW